MPEITGQIDRKYMGHLFDAGLLCHGTTSKWERIGDDLEEYNVDLSPDIETKKNILGQTSVHNNGYEETGDVDTFYANTGSELYKKMQEIIDYRHKDDNCKTNALEVHLWEKITGGGNVAWLQGCYLFPTSYGGNTSGYQTPFTVHYFGERTKGVFKDGEFTPDSEAGASVSEPVQAKAASKSNLS